MNTAITATYSVAGMTCEHCVAAVSEELSHLDGVTAVDVELNPGGESRVSVSTTAPVTNDQIRAAVEEAGYRMIETSG